MQIATSRQNKTIESISMHPIVCHPVTTSLSLIHHGNAQLYLTQIYLMLLQTKSAFIMITMLLLWTIHINFSARWAKSTIVQMIDEAIGSLSGISSIPFAQLPTVSSGEQLLLFLIRTAICGSVGGGVVLMCIPPSTKEKASSHHRCHC